MQKIEITVLFFMYNYGTVYAQGFNEKLFNLKRISYELHGSNYSLKGIGTQNMADKKSHTINLDLGAEHSYNPATRRQETNFIIGLVIKLK